MEKLIDSAKRIFEQKFGRRPLMIASPGRINLIGEHTDYNEGFVLPGATDRVVVMAVAEREDELCRFYALDFDQYYETTLNNLQKSPLRWPDYLQGVLDQFLKAGYKIRGIDLAFGGNIPIGGGMSSSAAVEGGIAFALNHLYGLGLDLLTLTKIAQKAENEFVGVKCGIMDMFANLHGQEKKVMKIDCRSLEYEYFPFEREDVRVVISDTMVRRELASSEYNVRRRQCEEGVRLLQNYYPGVKSLRDVTLSMLEDHRPEFDPVVWKRCVYVVKENLRVEEACLDLKNNNFLAFGHKMNESHEGLKNEYEVSSPELDLLVESARKVPGVFGSRMMGAGFGGCTISLVEAGAVAEFQKKVSADYQRQTGKIPAIHVVRVEAGTRIVE
ncbi:MAG: galactokinase [Candidatus Saccharicenans sp.]